MVLFVLADLSETAKSIWALRLWLLRTSLARLATLTGMLRRILVAGLRVVFRMDHRINVEVVLAEDAVLQQPPG